MSGGMDNKEQRPEYWKEKLSDTGNRTNFASGSIRETTDNKGSYELLSPIFVKRVAIHLEKGAKKYAHRNWEKGQPMARTLQSLIRHAFEYLEGDRSEDHLAAIGCNAMFLAHFEEMIKRGLLPKELDDLPRYTKVESGQ